MVTAIMHFNNGGCSGSSALFLHIYKSLMDNRRNIYATILNALSP